MDLAPNYAGTMMGVTNTVGNFAGFVAPYVTGLIIDGQVGTINEKKHRIHCKCKYFSFASDLINNRS